MALNPTQLADFVTNTLPYYRRKKWKDLSLDLQRYFVVSRFFQNAKMTVRGGQYIQEQVQVDFADTFKKSGLFGTVGSKIVDQFKTVQVGWTASTVNWGYDVDEDAFQSGPETLLRTIDGRIHGMWNGYFTGLENEFWGTSSGPDAQPSEMLGLFDWIQKASSSTAEFGFNGGNPTNYPNGIGGLDSDLYPNWANGNFGYQTVGQNDLFRKMAEACDKCYFESVHSYAELGGNEKPQYTICTTYPVLQACHNQLTASNDNLEVDLGKYRGEVLFKGNPVQWVPALTNDSSPVQDVTNPVIGIDWSVLDIIMKSGRDRHELPVVIPESQPTVRVHHVKSWYNSCCTDRRRLWVGSNPDLAA